MDESARESWISDEIPVTESGENDNNSSFTNEHGNLFLRRLTNIIPRAPLRLQGFRASSLRALASV